MNKISHRSVIKIRRKSNRLFDANALNRTNVNKVYSPVLFVNPSESPKSQ